MSFKLHIFTHDQDNVQIPSIVSIIVYNMYLEASELCVWGVTTSLRLDIVFLHCSFLCFAHCCSLLPRTGAGWRPRGDAQTRAADRR